MNRLRQATARMASRLSGRAGDSAIYTRDAGTDDAVAKSISIVLGRERDIAKDSTLAAMFRQSGWDRDVLIAATEFKATGFDEPLPGDRIEITEDGSASILEVFLPDGERAWRWSDQTRTIYRIHCKQAS